MWGVESDKVRITTFCYGLEIQLGRDPVAVLIENRLQTTCACFRRHLPSTVEVGVAICRSNCDSDSASFVVLSFAVSPGRGQAPPPWTKRNSGQQAVKSPPIKYERNSEKETKGAKEGNPALSSLSLSEWPLTQTQRILNDSSFDDSWAVLSTAFTQIHNKNASELSFEVLYRNAYTVVLHKDGEKLYNAAKQVVAAHLKTVAAGEIYTAYQELVNAPGTRDYDKQDAGVRCLKVVRDAWEDHTLCMRMIRDVLMYLVLSHQCTRALLMLGSHLRDASQCPAHI